MACLAGPLGAMGRFVGPALKYTHDYIGIPNNLKNPIPLLSKTLCLDERVALTFAAVTVLGVFATSGLYKLAKHSLIVIGCGAVYVVARNVF